mgnify:FL=1
MRFSIVVGARSEETRPVLVIRSSGVERSRLEISGFGRFADITLTEDRINKRCCLIKVAKHRGKKRKDSEGALLW